MNVTDIDDKIIKRARQNYLYEHYISENSTNLNQLLTDYNDVLEEFNKNIDNTADTEKKQMLDNMLKK